MTKGVIAYRAAMRVAVEVRMEFPGRLQPENPLEHGMG
jgi:hypothetical protein